MFHGLKYLCYGSKDRGRSQAVPTIKVDSGAIVGPLNEIKYLVPGAINVSRFKSLKCYMANPLK
jgi:hypothetical protein